ncbi:MAG: OmpA family protein [Myxococcota bacterium]
MNLLSIAARWAPALVCLVGVLAASSARAESGRYNLHGSALGPFPLAGEVSFDWQFAQPLVLELRVGGGVVLGAGDTINGESANEGVFYSTVGPRFRFIDDESGFLNEGGSIAGNLWLSPQVGLAILPEGPVLLTDVSVGYEFSIANPVSIGPFLRGGVAVANDIAPVIAGGIQVSIEFDPLRDPPVDGDGDGVFDRMDACPGTPPNTEVDSRGCIPLPPALVLEGIEFEYDSAEILPVSEHVLRRGVQLLQDNPNARVEVGGHTDNTGSPEYNQQLSEQRARAVRDWLVRQGIPARRLQIRGYGASQPRVPNRDEESRAMNRRIEFRQIPPGTG